MTAYPPLEYLLKQVTFAMCSTDLSKAWLLWSDFLSGQKVNQRELMMPPQDSHLLPNLVCFPMFLVITNAFYFVSPGTSGLGA